MSDRTNDHVTAQMLLGGRYQVESELGRGGMATVFKGTDTVLGRPVAVKVLSPQYAGDANFVTRFRREAQAAARLNHPNLVSVYDTGTDDGIHFIVMEYVDAKTLADYLAGGGRIMPERAIEIAEAVCDALSMAHAHGIIHRDIKPPNIMITSKGDVKVTDFGIARVISGADTLAQTAAVLGTASYLSPEQAQSQPVDQRSNIYSLGCVLRDGDGASAVLRGLAGDGGVQARAGAAHAALEAEPRRRTRARGGDHEGPSEESGQPVPGRRRDARRPGASPAGPDGPGHPAPAGERADPTDRPIRSADRRAPPGRAGGG